MAGMQISGLASGMDIDSMVRAMLQPQQNKIDKLLRARTLNTWRQEAYNEINSTLARFVLDRKSALNMTMTSGGINYDKTLSAMTWVKSASSSNTSAVMATCSTSAANGTFKVNVKKLAENWSAASGGALEETGSESDGLWTQLGLGENDVIDFTIKTAKGEVRVTSNNDVPDGANVIKVLKVDMKNVSTGVTTKATTLKDLASQLNQKGIGVTASYDSNLKRFFLQTTDTGEKNTIKVTDVSKIDGSTGFIAGSNNLLKMQTTEKKADGTYAAVESDDSLFKITAALKNSVGINESLATAFGFENLENNVGTKLDVSIKTNKGEIRVTNDPSQKDKTVNDGVLYIENLETYSIGDFANGLTQFNVGITANITMSEGNITGFNLSSQDGVGNITITDNSVRLSKETIEGVEKVVEKKVDFIGGADSKIKLTADTTKATNYSGKDAEVDIGAAIGIKQSSNDFTINGVNYSLKGVTKEDEPVTIVVASDINGAYDKIKSFFDEYNKLIDTLNVKLKEKYDKSYAPLLDEERKSLSSDQITAWEAKGKVGLLKGDTDISNMLNTIRDSIFKEVEGIRSDMNSLSKIGISTEMYDTSIGGKITIDEAKLKEALQKDAGAVMNLLFRSPDKATETDKDIINRQSGAINRVFTGVVDGMKNMINKAGTGNNEALYRSVQFNILIDYFSKNEGVGSIQQLIKTQNNTLADLNTSFLAKQTSYYNRFTAMEVAINNANSQSGWLSSQFSQG